MHQLIFMGVEVLSAAAVLLPVLLLLHKRVYHDRRKTAAYAVFSLYLAAVYAVVGLPSVTYLAMDPVIQWIPFAGMAADFKNAILNVILFIPLGVLLPLFWKEFRCFRKTFLFGFGMTAMIELLQLFTFRTTDINDIITNVAGTMIGYATTWVILGKHPAFPTQEDTVKEALCLSLITFSIMFVIQPFLSSLIWQLVL